MEIRAQRAENCRLRLRSCPYDLRWARPEPARSGHSLRPAGPMGRDAGAARRALAGQRTTNKANLARSVPVRASGENALRRHYEQGKQSQLSADVARVRPSKTLKSEAPNPKIIRQPGNDVRSAKQSQWAHGQRPPRRYGEH